MRPVDNRVYTIVLREDGFHPEALTIPKNGIVKFVTTRGKQFWPASNLHPTHEIFPEFDPKHPIEPSGSWQFTFGKIGRWRYHDHLFPNFTGIIIVRNGDDADQKMMATSCVELPIGKKQACWDDLLQTTLEAEGLDAAFRLFGKLYTTEPSVPKGCHGWGHTLGKAAYKEYAAGHRITFAPETAYCGYGFYHGFMEQLLLKNRDMSKVKDFCIHLRDEAGRQGSLAYSNCIHGIGHGSVDIDDERIWGDFQKMIAPGLLACETSFTDSSEREVCLEGAFNAMSLNTIWKQYRLSFDRTDPFSICRMQEKKHQQACYFEFTGLLSQVTNHTFTKALSFLDEIAGRTFAPHIMQKFSADFFQDDIFKSDYTNNVLQCRNVSEDLRSTCFSGILLGFIAHGEPEFEYKKGLAFCGLDMLTKIEREACYAYLLGDFKGRYSGEKFRGEVCPLLHDDVKRNYCNPAS